MNFSLIGPPGSGKGSYGKYFARSFRIRTHAVSDLLKKFRPELDISSGKLIEDDSIVGETVLKGLQHYYRHSSSSSSNNNNMLNTYNYGTDITTKSNNHNSNGNNNKQGYIIDGYPRTFQQITYMEEQFPELFRIQYALHLNVPDVVCKTKLLGRRSCSKCGNSYNINSVDWNGWLLPSKLPKEEHICESTTIMDMKINTNTDTGDKNNTDNDQCDWSVKRDDDTPDIIDHRLMIYHQNLDPILEYYRTRGRLLTLTPHNGFDDIPKLVHQIHAWLNNQKRRRRGTYNN